MPLQRLNRMKFFPVLFPAEFGVDGFFFRYKKHFVYWRYLSNSEIGIVTILHQCMHQIGQFKDDYEKK